MVPGAPSVFLRNRELSSEALGSDESSPGDKGPGRVRDGKGLSGGEENGGGGQAELGGKERPQGKVWGLPSAHRWSGFLEPPAMTGHCSWVPEARES